MARKSSRKQARSPSPDTLEPDYSPPPSPTSFTLSQHPQTFEQSQSLPQAKHTEKQRLSDLNPTITSKAITSLSRLLLFKALSGQAIDRRKCFEALPPEIKSDRISNALLEQAEARLQNVWGFKIKGVPDFMANSLPAKYKDRYYVINHVSDHDGRHSLTIHNQEHTCEEKGFLMVVLALAFCKGTPIQSDANVNGNSRSNREDDRESIYTARWIHDTDLYRLLNNIDDSITEEPPRFITRGAGSKRKSFSTTISSPSAPSRRSHGSNVVDVEALLEKFVGMDYLLKEKSAGFLGSISQDGGRNEEFEEGFCYAMGPRAALEVGRRQLIYFCADVLDEQPDPTMLEEINDEVMEEDEEDGEYVR